MIQLPEEYPKPEVLEQLVLWQQELERVPDYAQRVSEAKRLFESRNREDNSTFREIRGTLRTMSGGTQRCVCCEDSLAYQVEHVRPKSLYPEAVFVWKNMLWACGRCNTRKLNRCAIIVGNELRDVTRRPKDPVVPPPPGKLALIDPVGEDPFSFMILDLADTFHFVAHPELKGRIARERVRHTIDDVLGLNDDPLPERRFGAYSGFRSALCEIVFGRERGKSETQLAGFRRQLAARDHQTVWREIQRQFKSDKRSKQLVDDFEELFAAVPDALTW
ncbi:MAG: hypothetical protein HC927_10405 [Deltaproteobacteria bacterium]|nr:hypothetical protein [Deltaproteobacteria bacterium]